MIRSATRSEGNRAAFLRRLAGLALGASALLAATACDSGTRGRTLPPVRYRLTAQVETPEGLRTGSSVIEVQWTKRPEALGTQGSASYRVEGEAVAVDLPKGETLFVLLSSPIMVDWAAGALADTGIQGQDGSAKGADTLPHPVPRQRKLASDTIDNYPFFVRFRDRRDPTTVEQVDPDNLAASFGEGTRLKALTVQMTADSVTTGIVEKLPWISTHRGSLVKFDSDTPISKIPEVLRLTEGAFKWGTGR